MDLAGQPVPLGLDAGLVMDRREFGLSRLQPLDENGSLLALLDHPDHPQAEEV